MRLAVALPNLGPDAPILRGLEEVIFELMRSGTHVEGFVELDRRRRSSEGFKVFHYLRLPERHAGDPFDLALYPLGRDLQAFQPVVASMRLLPGIVWALDPILHHLWLSGTARHLRWGEYRDLMNRAHPGRGTMLLDVVAASWASDAFYRAYDPTTSVLGRQRAVIAASEGIALSLPRELRAETPVISLPRVDDNYTKGPRNRTHRAEYCGWPDRPRLLIATLNGNQPGPILDGLGRMMSGPSRPQVTVCVGKAIFNTNFAAAARRSGVHEHTRWIIDPDDATVAREARAADIVAFLRRDPTAGDRILIDSTLSSGSVVIVRRTALYGDLPDGVVAKVDPGHAQGWHLARTVEALAADPGLAAGLRAAGREYSAARPTARTVAFRLRAALTALESAEERSEDSHGRRHAWCELAVDLEARLTPPEASSTTHAEIVAALAESGLWPDSEISRCDDSEH